MAVKTIQRETHEYIPVVIIKDGSVVTTGLAYAIVPFGDRPTSWTAMTVSGSNTYVEAINLAAGYYDIYVQITDSPEVPVIRTGNLRVE